MKHKLGIGITTHNRYETFKKCLLMHTTFLPENAKIVVVDDASTIPVEEASYRFSKNVGIARSKNKCLELLQDCEHIFLFDDDCWPIDVDWWKPYVDSPEPHLMYIFKDFTNRPLKDSIELYRDSQHVGYSHPRGCMLYFDNKCLKVVGGMDTAFKRWGHEHVDISNRIFNNGLTSLRYADVVGSNKIIYSCDENEEVAGTVPAKERKSYLSEMRKYIKKSFQAKHYCEFREVEPTVKSQNNKIICAYFTSKVDAQRGIKWETKPAILDPLIDSVVGSDLVIIHDCLDNTIKRSGVEYKRVECVVTPYAQRWMEYYRYLRDHPEIDNAFIVDSTDVKMLKNPFPYMRPGIIYVGDEPSTINKNWLRRSHPHPVFIDFINNNRQLPMLNCGVVGGSREDLMSLCHDIFKIYFDTNGNFGKTEMGAFNYICHTKYKDVIEHGRHVTTIFKEFEEESDAFFKHK